MDAPHLQALHDPSPRLDLAPRHVLQQDRPRTRGSRLREGAGPLAAAALVHLGFAVALVLLLTSREIAPPREVEIPVEIVTAPPEPPKPAAPAVRPQGSGQAAQALQQAMGPPVAPDPHPPAPPRMQPVAPPQKTPPPETPKPETPPAEPTPQHAAKAPAEPAPPPAPNDGTEPPKLLAPPPEPARAATQDRESKPANLVPDQDKTDAATHEARPAEVPRTLVTGDAAAAFAVPAPLPPKPDPLPKAAPPVPDKVPSAADKLAAALPMDTSAMPLSFRNVLAGNGAQVSAAYKGLVYGLFKRNAAVAERAQRQRLKGQVIVAFTIDDTGKLTELAVVQSSGNPAVDALGLEMIRAAAPFPPPPPEAQRSFAPALSFGP